MIVIFNQANNQKKIRSDLQLLIGNLQLVLADERVWKMLQFFLGIIKYFTVNLMIEK